MTLKKKRIKELRKGFDSTNEIEDNDLKFLKDIDLTIDFNKLVEADVYLVTVPTPIDINNKPNLKPLKSACKQIGNVIKFRSQIKRIKFHDHI